MIVAVIPLKQTMNKLYLITGWVISLIVAFVLGDYYELGRSTPVPTEHGRFLSTPKLDALDDGETFKLLEDFVYVDPNGAAWLAPKGRKVDGASIPRMFWTPVGSPMKGKYRNASVVHDIECDDRKVSSEKVHLMFFHACLAGGVPEREAKKLYWAVARFGPKWVEKINARNVEFTGRDGELKTYTIMETGSQLLPARTPTKADLVWAREYFDQHDPPIEIIPSLGGSLLGGAQE